MSMSDVIYALTGDPHSTLVITTDELLKVLGRITDQETGTYFLLYYGLAGYRTCTYQEIASIEKTSTTRVRAKVIKLVKVLRSYYSKPKGKRCIKPHGYAEILHLTGLDQRYARKSSALFIKMIKGLYVHPSITCEKNLLQFRLYYGLGFTRTYSIAEIAEAFNCKYRDVVFAIKQVTKDVQNSSKMR